MVAGLPRDSYSTRGKKVKRPNRQEEGIARQPGNLQAEPREARDVEWLLWWCYARQLPHYGEGGFGGGGGDPLAPLQTLGTVVQSSRGGGGGAVHHDAALINERVHWFGQEDAALLIGHARLYTRPDWHPLPVLRYEPVYRDWTRRKIKRIYDANRHWIGCEVRLVERQGFAQQQRESYRRWHRRLVELAWLLQRADLRKFAATGPAAPSAPWVESTRRVLLDRRGSET